MPFMDSPKSDKCGTVRTISQVTTAVCLLIITIGFIVAGTWTVNTVHTLQSTYHPEKLKSMLDTVSDTLDTVHKTTFSLQSGKPINLMDDVHRLVISLEKVSNSLQRLPVEKMVGESESWRTLSKDLLQGIKKTINEL